MILFTKFYIFSYVPSKYVKNVFCCGCVHTLYLQTYTYTSFLNFLCSVFFTVWILQLFNMSWLWRRFVRVFHSMTEANKKLFLSVGGQAAGSWNWLRQPVESLLDPSVHETADARIFPTCSGCHLYFVIKDMLRVSGEFTNMQFFCLIELLTLKSCCSIRTMYTNTKILTIYF